MAKLLILYLEAPLQSWGVRSRWDVRDTGEEPSKSGVVGLLGCALGYRSGDRRLVDLDEQLRMGVRVERPGISLTDFHTVSGVMRTADGRLRGSEEAPNTIVSHRTYLHDAAFLVVLSGPDELLERCAAALRKPKWPIYLGRKACVPSRPVLQELTSSFADIEDALQRYPWEKRTEADTPSGRLRCVIEDESGDRIRPDRYEGSPIGMYGQRRVRVQWVPVPEVVKNVASS